MSRRVGCHVAAPRDLGRADDAERARCACVRVCVCAVQRGAVRLRAVVARALSVRARARRRGALSAAPSVCLSYECACARVRRASGGQRAARSLRRFCAADARARTTQLLGTGAFKKVYKGVDTEQGIEVAWAMIDLDRAGVDVKQLRVRARRARFARRRRAPPPCAPPMRPTHARGSFGARGRPTAREGDHCASGPRQHPQALRRVARRREDAGRWRRRSRRAALADRRLARARARAAGRVHHRSHDVGHAEAVRLRRAPAAPAERASNRARAPGFSRSAKRCRGCASSRTGRDRSAAHSRVRASVRFGSCCIRNCAVVGRRSCVIGPRACRQIIDGLVYLHGQARAGRRDRRGARLTPPRRPQEPPVIHRDIKCDNIFLHQVASRARARAPARRPTLRPATGQREDWRPRASDAAADAPPHAAAAT